MPGISLCRIPDPIPHPAPQKNLPPSHFLLADPPFTLYIKARFCKESDEHVTPVPPPNILDYPI